MDFGRYKHFKGNEYVVVALVRHSETEEVLVLYHPASKPDDLWVRPKAMFEEQVVHNGEWIPRFRYIGQ
ncbi:MAG: DUF1653 domain-containing protein [Erysipelotrichaceae bacterium]